jgi:predicted Zn-dependent protease
MMSLHWVARAGAIGALAVTGGLSGCQNMKLPESLDSLVARQPTKAGPTSSAVSKDEVAKMLIHSDPKVCHATTDASYGEIATTYAKIGVSYAPTLANAATMSDAQLQRTLDEFRPHLRELSSKTAWLPMDAERLVGDRVYEYNKMELWTPPSRQRKLLNETITPMFNELKRYSAEEVKSPLPFEMRVVRADDIKAPMAIAGGIVLIPSGLFSAMSSVQDPAPIIAFMMAHEFAHSLRRHTTKLVQLSLVESMTKAKEYRKLAKSTRTGFGSLRGMDQMVSFSSENVGSLMTQVCESRNWYPSMEQNQENEADVCGILLLNRLGTSTGRRFNALDGYLGYLNAGLATQVPPGEAGGCTVKTSHPSPDERAQNLRSYSSTLAAQSQ